MVLINELTVEQINAALLHLQRSKDEVVGGNKGTTIQNITISNSGGGGGNNVDYSGTIKNLANLIDKNISAIEKNAGDIAKLKSDFSNIEKSVEDTLEGLVDNGISDLSFDPLTKQLTISTNGGDIYQAVIEQDVGFLSYDSATNKLTLTTGNQSQEITLPYIKTSEKGSANGVATLDENGRVPYSQLPESAMEFLGQWNASTNTPHLADGTGTNGDFYIVSTGGTVNLGTAQDPHIVTFSINDRIVYEGDIAQWVRLPAGQVSSVNGQSGEVTLTASDIEYSTGVSIKAKIDANAVQADWSVSDTTSLAYIKNKPTIPASPVQSDWNVTDTTSLAYIKNKPATNLVCTCKYTSAYDFDVVLTNTCDSQTQYAWVSATCRLRFCSTTGVLTAACFCGTASNATNVNCGVHVYNPTNPSNTRRYLKIKVSQRHDTHGSFWFTAHNMEGYLNLDEGQIQRFTSSDYSGLQTSICSYNCSCSDCFWLSYASWWKPVICSGDNFTILCDTTTAPSGITFTGTAQYAPYAVHDSSSGCNTTFAYSKAGLSSNPSYLAAWNGYELRAVAPSVVHVACADRATNADHATCADVGYNSCNGSYQAFGCNAFSNASLGNTYWGSISSASNKIYNVVLSETSNHIGVADNDSSIRYCPFNRTLITGCFRGVLEGKVGKSETNFCDTQVGKNLHYICFRYNIPQSTLFSCLRTITCCYDMFGYPNDECYYHGAIGSRARTETTGSREIGSIVVWQCCVQFRDNANSVVMTARCDCGSQIGSNTSLLVMFRG